MAEDKPGRKKTYRGTFAIVSGGSKGIGKATVNEIVRRGGSVCIIAREPGALAAAAEEARALKVLDDQFVVTISCDATDMQTLGPALEEVLAAHGVPDYLFNVVGYAYPQNLEKLTLADFRRNMDVNYYGQLVPILILLPHFIEARKGHIANVSSPMGFFGAMGYGTYAPTKYAIVGLTEVLRNELKPYNIKTSILFPPDTETPGFEEENLSKPEVLALMSARVKIVSPEQVARDFVEGVAREKFNIFSGQARILWLLNRLSPGLMRFLADREYRKARELLTTDRPATFDNLPESSGSNAHSQDFGS